MPTDEDLLTKEQIAELLSPGQPLTVRSVERYISLAEVSPAEKGGGRGQVSRFRRSDVEKIVTAYRAAKEARESGESQALAPRTNSAVAAFEGLLGRQAEGFEALRSALDPWPVWIDTKRAVELSGMPPSWLHAGLRKGELAAVGKRTTRRIHRDDLRAFCDKVKEPEFLAALLTKSAT